MGHDRITLDTHILIWYVHEESNVRLSQNALTAIMEAEEICESLDSFPIAYSDNPNVNVARDVFPHSLDFAPLQYTKQIQRHIADLVQYYRATRGRFRYPYFLTIILRVAEKSPAVML